MFRRRHRRWRALATLLAEPSTSSVRP
jgi:hypothetical protein